MANPLYAQYDDMERLHEKMIENVDVQMRYLNTYC